MAMIFYPALFYSETGSFSVMFADLPGCVSQGSSIQEAGERAAEALALHVEGILEEGKSLPEPSALDSALPEWMMRHGEPVARALMPVERLGARVHADITIDQILLARVDAAACAQGMSRSGYIARAVREKLARVR